MVTAEMGDDCERINAQWPPFADAFREIYRFILKALEGNAAAANALFQKYLNGELPDELLQISRSWVQEEQACSPSRSEGESIGAADPQVSRHWPVKRRRLRRAGREWRRGRQHLPVGGGAAESSLHAGKRS
jgi:hypothetical protein